MTLEAFVFGATFVVALGSSLAMLLAPNPVHVALFLVAAQVALAVTFLLQGAFFIAAVQVILYAGAIMVLFLFVIMLLGIDRRDALGEPLPGQRLFAGGLGLLLAAQVLYLLLANSPLDDASAGERALAEANRDPGNVESLAAELFGRHLFSFETTSILLVVAIVGVMALARRLAHGTSTSRAADEDHEEAA